MAYPFVFPNYKHQQAEFDQFKDAKARALLWSMRTGKSKAMIDLACYLYSKGKIDLVLVIAPNGVHINWHVNQIPVHMWKTIPFRSMYWSAPKERTKKDYKLELDKFMRSSFDGLTWLEVNSEGVIHAKPKALLEKFVAKSKVGILLVVDESSDFRTPGSKRGRLVRKIATHCTFKRILDGSAFDNSPLHSWGQFEILEKGALGYTDYGSFEAEYATYKKAFIGKRQFMQIDGFKNLEDLREKIARYSSSVRREDVDDMPELNHSTEVFEMTAGQQELYTRISEKIIEENVQFPTNAVFDGGSKSLKLQQVSSGFFIDEHGEELILNENPRLDLLKRVLQEQYAEGKKVIIWARFTVEIRMILEALDEMKIPRVAYYGAVPASQRVENITKFMASEEPMVFVGNPQAGGRGLDLSAASTIIWYSRDYDLIKKRQADERATHVGGKSIDVIDLLGESTVDLSIMKALEDKITISEVIDRLGLQAFLEGQIQVFDQEVGL